MQKCSLKYVKKKLQSSFEYFHSQVISLRDIHKNDNCFLHLKEVKSIVVFTFDHLHF